MYSEWVDACDEIANPKDKATGRVSGGGVVGRGGAGGDGGAGARTQQNRDRFDELDDEDDHIARGYSGRPQAMVNDDEDDF